MSVTLEYDASDIQAAIALARKLQALSGEEFMEGVGAELESSVRKRLSGGGPAPDESDWEAWSPAYKETRHSGHSLLANEGDLRDSITYLASDSIVEVGSNLPYAATHQFGDDDRNIPERPYLGISPDDEEEIQAIINDYFGGLLR